MLHKSLYWWPVFIYTTKVCVKFHRDNHKGRAAANQGGGVQIRQHLNHTCDVGSLITSTGKLPTVSKGTHVIIPLVDELEDGRWEAVIERQDEKRLKLSVNSPPTACIGQYQLTVETTCANGQYISVHNPANDIFMLFNPWSECNVASKKVLLLLTILRRIFIQFYNFVFLQHFLLLMTILEFNFPIQSKRYSQLEHPGSS